ncbi:MAG: hypothetical protein SF123_14395 [Chloroflexota bacterium]|nr:hypothetical protein [Chloroflexota bacterium]
MDVKRLAIVVGIVLIVVTIVSVIGVSVTPTAFLPGIGGVILIVLGVLASQRENLARHAMHGAMLVALLMALGSLRVFTLLGNPDANPIVIAGQLITLGASVVLLVFGIQSFIAARRARST